MSTIIQRLRNAYWSWRMTRVLGTVSQEEMHDALIALGYTWHKDGASGTVVYHKGQATWTFTDIGPEADARER